MSLIGRYCCKSRKSRDPEISRMSIFSEIYCCNASWCRYEGPWSFLREMMWSLTSSRANRVSGLYNFCTSPEKYFCNNIGHISDMAGCPC